MKEDFLSTSHKAFQINQDSRIYGTFAEIGAGQEVARFFFQAGQASQTVAKTMSAYDMTFSDTIYGRGERYVSLKRLQNMLQHEFHLLEQRLKKKKGKSTCFFAFANTVTTSSQSHFHNPLFSSHFSSCHGWLGLRFQTHPGGAYSDIFFHVHMLDRFRLQQQEALGVLGVNLIHSAFYLYGKGKKEKFISSLVDGLHQNRIEIDFIEIKGPDVNKDDNSLMNLDLIQNDLSKTVLLGPEKKSSHQVLHLRESIYQKSLFFLRNDSSTSLASQIALLKDTQKQIKTLHKKKGSVPSSAFLKSYSSPFSFTSFLSLEEDKPLIFMTLYKKVLKGSQHKKNREINQKLLRHIKKINSSKFPVLVSSFPFLFSLKSHLRQYTEKNIFFLIHSSELIQIFENKINSFYKKGLSQEKTHLVSYSRLDFLKVLSELFDPHVFLVLSNGGSVQKHSSFLDTKEEAQKNPFNVPSFISKDLVSFFSKRKSLQHFFHYLLEERHILHMEKKMGHIP